MSRPVSFDHIKWPQRAILVPMRLPVRLSLIPRQNWALALVLLALWSATLACSSLQDVIGPQQRGGPTPTLPLFATATPGGSISVFLVTPTGQADVSDQAGTPVTS